MYLDTDNPDDVPYYASFGFEEIGQRRLPRGVRDVVYEASLRRWASGSPSSFFSVLFSIWRIRSRVTSERASDLLERTAPCGPSGRSASDHLALA